MAEPVDQQAMFVEGPSRGNKYNSKYLVDEAFYMYKRKHKTTDSVRHIVWTSFAPLSGQGPARARITSVCGTLSSG